MSYGGGHLGFPIGIKNIKFVEDFSEITRSKTKLPRNDHWKVLYKVYVIFMPIENSRWPPPHDID
jgi:hypothetical protein